MKERKRKVIRRFASGEDDNDDVIIRHQERSRAS